MTTSEAASAFITFIGIACFLALVAYNLGRVEGRTVKLRGACDAERIHLLKPGYYAQVKS